MYKLHEEIRKSLVSVCMKRVDLDSIILLVIVLVVVFGIYYDFKVSVDLAPDDTESAVGALRCLCPYDVGDSYKFPDGDIGNVIRIANSNKCLGITGSIVQCPVTAACDLIVEYDSGKIDPKTGAPIINTAFVPVKCEMKLGYGGA